MENNNIEYKWKKLFASMRFDTDTGIISLTPEDQQELIDDISSLRELKSDLLHSVSESYIKCWNCKQFEQTGTNTMGNEVGNCKLNDCKVSLPKWQKCGEYEQCGNFR